MGIKYTKKHSRSWFKKRMVAERQADSLKRLEKKKLRQMKKSKPSSAAAKGGKKENFFKRLFSKKPKANGKGK